MQLTQCQSCIKGIQAEHSINLFSLAEVECDWSLWLWWKGWLTFTWTKKKKRILWIYAHIYMSLRPLMTQDSILRIILTMHRASINLTAWAGDGMFMGAFRQLKQVYVIGHLYYHLCICFRLHRNLYLSGPIFLSLTRKGNVKNTSMLLQYSRQVAWDTAMVQSSTLPILCS